MKNSEGEKVYSFLRRLGGDTVLVVINFAREPRSVTLGMKDWKTGNVKEYFTGSVLTLSDAKLELEIGGLGCRVFVPTEQQSGGGQ